MSQRAHFMRRSLAAQGVFLAAAVTVLAAAAVGYLASRRMTARLAAQLDLRGSSMAGMMERHKDLHAAALRHDAEEAQDALETVVSNDHEVEYAALLDPKGKVLAAAAREAEDPLRAVQAELTHHPLSTPGLTRSDSRVRRFTQAVAADEGEQGAWAADDGALYAAGATIGYVVLGMRDRSAALAGSHALVTVAGVGLALVSAFLLFFLRLTRRLRRMVVFAEALAAHDLSADLPEGAADEVGRVGAALRSIREATQRVVAELSAAAEALRASSQALHGSAQTQRARAEGQVERVAQIGANVSELQQASQLARDDAEVVIRGAAQRGQDAEMGKRAAAESSDAVDGLRRAIAGTARALADLSGRSLRIDEIARTVADLADRSHLLAINTGIEAARAGDEGRSFRILADEMRQLAHGSREATARVRTMLIEIARAAQVSLKVVAAGNEKAEEAVERARQAAEVIDELRLELGRFVETAGRIAARAHQQAAAVAAISSEMAEVRLEADEAAASVVGLEATSREVLARAERIHRTVGAYRLRPAP